MRCEVRGAPHRCRAEAVADEFCFQVRPIKPVGAYRLTMQCDGSDARMALETVSGPLLLAGTGGMVDGHWRFAGRAEAAPGFERDLANFMNLLGETRREGGRDVIALNFQ